MYLTAVWHKYIFGVAQIRERPLKDQTIRARVPSDFLKAFMDMFAPGTNPSEAIRRSMLTTMAIASDQMRSTDYWCQCICDAGIDEIEAANFLMEVIKKLVNKKTRHEPEVIESRRTRGLSAVTDHDLAKAVAR